MEINRAIARQAILKASKGHTFKSEVQQMLGNIEEYITSVIDGINDGTYKERLAYRSMQKKNHNGKVRDILSPSLLTRVYQHLFLQLAIPIYQRRDPHVGMNCKEGYGITAESRNKSLLHRLKHIVYDCDKYEYAVILDQRKCYEHITPKQYRRAMKMLTDDKDLIDFGEAVSFCDGKFPIGTPTSPIVHHIIMLRFDLWIGEMGYAIRYADDVYLAVPTKEEAHRAAWRIRNFWWYEYGIRAKRGARIMPMTTPTDFCGYVICRTPNQHSKGYVRLRRSIADRAKRCKTNESWSAYFGLMKHADCYNLMQKIESQMNLRQLTERVKIDREMDAPSIAIKDLLGKVFTIYKYEIRKDAKGMPNWIKCVIGLYDQHDDEGNPIGREKAYEFHGGYQYIVAFIVECEKAFGKGNILPLEEMEIDNQCGYIFKGSTNQKEFVDQF